MNKKQVALIVGMVVMALLVPWFSVGMFFIGLAVGAFLSVILSD